MAAVAGGTALPLRAVGGMIWWTHSWWISLGEVCVLFPSALSNDACASSIRIMQPHLAAPLWILIGLNLLQSSVIPSTTRW